jgi:photosystem II stability/assembly factor-like uncharacterized protein
MKNNVSKCSARSFILCFCGIFIILVLNHPACIHAGINEWTHTGPPGLDDNVLDISRDPSDHAILYIAANSAFMYKSTDHGKSWLQLSEGIPEGMFIYDLAVHPASPSHLFAVGYTPNELYRSTDGGAHWFSVAPLDGVNTNVVHLYEGAPDTIMTGFNTVLKGGIDRSTDGGNTWSKTTLTGSVACIHQLTGPYDALLAGHTRGIHYSTDAGSSWIEVPGFEYDVRDITADPFAPNTIYAGTHIQGLYRNSDFGSEWELVPGTDSFSVSSIVANPQIDGMLILGTYEDGVQFRMKEGDNWKAHNDGLPPSDMEILSLVIEPIDAEAFHLFAGTSSTVYTYLYDLLPMPPESLQAVSRPDDIHLTWKAPVLNEDEITPLTDLQGYNIYRSITSMGYGDDPQNETPVADTEFFDDSDLEPGRTYFYVATAVDSLGGESGYSEEREILFPGEGILDAGFTGYYDGNTVHLKWRMPPGIHSVRILKGSREIFATDHTSVTGFEDSLVARGSTCEYRLFGKKGDGTEFLLGSVTIPLTMSPDRTVMCVSPNPFNPEIAIRITLAHRREPQHMSLHIFDVNGRLVRPLMNSSVTDGSITVRWDGKDDNGRNLPSGVYYLRLVRGNEEEVRKLVLLR